MYDEYIRLAKVINIVDGDTIDAIVDLGYYIKTTQRFRLLRVNTPELRSNDAQEKVRAIVAKEYVANKLLGKDVLIKSSKSDSFGRWLGEIWYVNSENLYVNINDELLSLGLAESFTR